jgi:hypothetical protein
MAIISAVLAGMVTTGYLSVTVYKIIQPIVRPDPFTGTRGLILEKRITDLEARVSELEQRAPK